MRLSDVSSWVLRCWTYFRRGHSVYLVFLMSFLNFIVIQYRLVVQNIPILYKTLPRLWIFTIVLLATYIPIATIIGWLDYKKGSVPTDRALGAKASPWVRDLAKALMLIADGKSEEAKKILEKWAE